MRLNPEPAPQSSIRAFVAVNLDPGLREVLARIQERLRSTRADVGWVRPENLHLTLKFLGQVEETRLVTVAEALDAASRGSGVFRLVLGGVGAFPHPRAPRVIWVGATEGVEALAALQGRIEQGLESLGFPREARPFTAHLTLGRVRGPGHREQLAVALTSMSAEPLGEMMARQIELMKSDLTAGGARYSILRNFPLG